MQVLSNPPPPPLPPPPPPPPPQYCANYMWKPADQSNVNRLLRSYQNLNMSGWILYARHCRQLRCIKIPVLKQRNNTILQYARQVLPNVATIPKINRHSYRLMSQVSKKFDDQRPENKHDEEAQESEQDLSNKTSRQKLTLIFAKYGVTAVVFHTVISLTSLGLCYVAVSRLVTLW